MFLLIDNSELQEQTFLFCFKNQLELQSLSRQGSFKKIICLFIIWIYFTTLID